MHGITCFSDSMCSFRTWGCFGTIWSRRWPFSPEQNIKWNSISTSPKQKKKRTKLQSNSIQVYSEMENSPLIFQNSPPPSNSISRPAPPRDSIHSRHVFPLYSEQNRGCFGTIWAEDGHFPAVEHKMEFNQYFSKAEKKNGNSSRTAFKYTPKWKTLPLFSELPPLIRFRDPPPHAIPSIPDTSPLYSEQVGKRK
ncbi:hypothetical protein CEXT_55341 [Caerostris extrusa]|uniref:Uncharacterized protein n=1 Tax=Caerostris extrusa TaxID=172846 RepID=A0AAV4TT08_CAEEX|nr:hypothetical protein CEXT_55341 [Caerostris extrusa]